MTVLEFDSKWRKRLEPSHYGLIIGDENVVRLIDSFFEKWNKLYPNFTYSQIKTKFGSSRVYCENVPFEEVRLLEKNIDLILNNISSPEQENEDKVKKLMGDLKKEKLL